MGRYSKDSEYIFSPAKTGNLLEDINNNLPLAGKYSKLKDQSIPLKGTESPGFSAIYRNAAFPEGLKKAVHPSLNTYGKLFDFSVKKDPDSPAFAYREYDYIQKKSADHYTTLSYATVDKRKRNFGAGLLYMLYNSPFKNSEQIEAHKLIDEHVANYGKYDKDFMSFILTIFAPNRYEWMLTDLMCQEYSITNSSLYDTLGPDVSRYILELTQSPVIVLDHHNIDTILNLKKAYPEDLKSLILLVSMDPLDLEGANQMRSFEDRSFVQRARELGCSLIDLDRLEKLGEIFPHKLLPVTPESTYTISFTSGTTGSRPKGVVLSNEVACAGITFIMSKLQSLKGGKAFSFLPLAHIFERQGAGFVLSYGGLIGFPQLGGSPLTLVEDLKLFKPTHMNNVPRVLTKFEAAIKAATTEHPTSQFKRNLFERIINTKYDLQSVVDGDPGSHLIYDNLFIKKIRAGLGVDQMQFMVTGSAPISVSTMKFLKAALNIGVAQGYGLTETFAGMSITEPYDTQPGSCGAPAVTSEIRIRELPEMGYHLNDEGGPRGELLIRGYQNFSHYYKNEEETNKAVDKEGWFYTGDVARIDERGRIYIIDRVKNFFKLSQGEYVTPEKVENLYLSQNPLLTQLFVHGESTHHYLVAIAGVDPVIGRQFLVSQGIQPDSIATDEEFLSKINERQYRTQLINALWSTVTKNTKLQGFEKIKNIYFEIEPLRLDRDVVTPTLKLRRPIASKFFAAQIEDMYKEGELNANESKL